MAIATGSYLNVSHLIAETIGQEMERDPAIVLLGEDVGYSGGTFGASRGLFKRFGEWRVRDTPISEMAFSGMAVGLAMSGWHPLIEVMFVDFVGVCLEQIYNAVAKNHYMSGGRVRMPVTFRAAGGCIGVGAQHSQSLWGMLAHLPGLKVVVPSNPYDMKGLLASALESDDPVFVIEHKDLYLRKLASFPIGREVPQARYTVPIGQAQLVRRGTDLTLATLGLSVERAQEAADELSRQRISVEVIDLRSVVPLDDELVAGSVAQTRRLLVVDEDYRSFGLSGELVARIIEKIGPSVLSAVSRLANPDIPIPAALSLEERVIPRTAAIVEAAQALLRKG